MLCQERNKAPASIPTGTRQDRGRSIAMTSKASTITNGLTADTQRKPEHGRPPARPGYVNDRRSIRPVMIA